MRTITDVEDDMLYLLPKDYRSFLLDEGNHQHPAWQLFASPAADVIPVDFSADFPFVHSHYGTNPIATLPGAIPLMHHECDYVVIVVRGQAAGQVWHVWGEDDCAMFRQVIHPQSRQPLQFAAWLELAEQEAALSETHRAGIEAGLTFPRDETEGRGLMNYLLWVADRMRVFPNEHMLLTPTDFKKLRLVALSVKSYRFCALDSASACAEVFEFSDFITSHSYAAFVEMALRFAENIVNQQPGNAQFEGSQYTSCLITARRFLAGTVCEKDLAACQSRLREVDSPVAQLVKLLLDPNFLRGTLEVGQWLRWDEILFEKMHEVSPRLGRSLSPMPLNDCVRDNSGNLSFAWFWFLLFDERQGGRRIARHFGQSLDISQLYLGTITLQRKGVSWQQLLIGLSALSSPTEPTPVFPTITCKASLAIRLQRSETVNFDDHGCYWGGGYQQAD